MTALLLLSALLFPPASSAQIGKGQKLHLPVLGSSTYGRLPPYNGKAVSPYYGTGAMTPSLPASVSAFGSPYYRSAVISTVLPPPAQAASPMMMAPAPAPNNSNNMLPLMMLPALMKAFGGGDSTAKKTNNPSSNTSGAPSGGGGAGFSAGDAGGTGSSSASAPTPSSFDSSLCANSKGQPQKLQECKLIREALNDPKCGTNGTSYASQIKQAAGRDGKGIKGLTNFCPNYSTFPGSEADKNEIFVNFIAGVEQIHKLSPSSAGTAEMKNCPFANGKSTLDHDTQLKCSACMVMQRIAKNKSMGYRNNPQSKYYPELLDSVSKYCRKNEGATPKPLPPMFPPSLPSQPTIPPGPRTTI